MAWPKTRRRGNQSGPEEVAAAAAGAVAAAAQEPAHGPTSTRWAMQRCPTRIQLQYPRARNLRSWDCPCFFCLIIGFEVETMECAGLCLQGGVTLYVLVRGVPWWAGVMGWWGGGWAGVGPEGSVSFDTRVAIAWVAGTAGLAHAR